MPWLVPLRQPPFQPKQVGRGVGRQRDRTPTRSSRPPPSWPRPSARRPTRRPPTGSSPARPAPRRCRRRSASSAPAWRDYALAIGMDTAQGRPGDALEYTAGAGGAAFILGPAESSLAIIEGSLSYVTDTPDFWRRQYANYPEHGQPLHRRAGLLQAHHHTPQQLMEEMDLTRRTTTPTRSSTSPTPSSRSGWARMLGFKPRADEDRAAGR